MFGRFGCNEFLIPAMLGLGLLAEKGDFCLANNTTMLLVIFVLLQQEERIRTIECCCCGEDLNACRCGFGRRDRDIVRGRELDVCLCRRERERF